MWSVVRFCHHFFYISLKLPHQAVGLSQQITCCQGKQYFETGTSNTTMQAACNCEHFYPSISVSRGQDIIGRRRSHQPQATCCHRWLIMVRENDFLRKIKFLFSKGTEPEIPRSRSAGGRGRWSAPPPQQLPPVSRSPPAVVAFRGSPVDLRGLKRQQSVSSAVVTVLPQISQRRNRGEGEDGEKF